MKPILALALGCVVLVTGRVLDVPTTSIGVALESSPSTLLGCPRLQQWSLDWKPVAEGADHVVSASYECDHLKVHLDAAQYLYQEQGKEAAGRQTGELKAPDAGVEPSPWNLGGGFVVPTVVQQRFPWHREVATWFAVGDAPATTRLRVKALEVRDAVRAVNMGTTRFVVVLEAEPGLINDDLRSQVGSEIWSWYIGAIRTAETSL